ncbi:hypothetical protein CMK11_06930 [Candidatus Poribacteria bacterium]|nr:hypothetical protein [Candidatus Poribacteria bacterium]
MNRARWEPGAAFTHNGFAIRIASDATPHDVTAIVRVTADNGGPWEFPFVFPVVYRPVEFVQRNAWVFDPAPGGDGDGEMEAGERVFPRIRLRNVGVAEGRDVVVRLTTGNQHVTVVTGEVRHESWPAGEARNNDGFVVDIDRLTRPRDVAFGVSVEVDGAVRWAFRYTFPITSAPVSLVAESTWVYDPDRRDNIPEPGERVLPRLRLRNIGTEAATDLRATLVVTDPDITGPTAAASLDSLAVGHDWTVGSLWIDIAATAIPHDTVVVVIVTADNGGPWRVEIPVSVGAVSGLRVRSTNMSDDLPGGNDDGAANPGETVTITFSVGNDGTRALYNVQPSLSVDGSDIAVTGTVDPLESWTPTPGQRSRQFAFPIEVSASAQPRDVEVVLTVTADDADPFLYTLTVPIVVLPPDFTLRNAWVWEPIPGGGADGDVNPGERVFPRFRLMNIGPGAGSNVQASLVVLDSDVEVVSGFVTHDSWPVGVGRNNNGLVLDISPNATPHDVTLVLSVVADDAGPWGFSFTMPIVAAQVAPTALLANYPNPFNPETWIPFDLSEAADVMVSVYDMQGALVRRIDLGRLERGIYRSREDAVYWDGRDEIGERASSGLYLYELRAGGHREIRRMVVRK